MENGISSVILLGHGSRKGTANSALGQIARRVADLLPPGRVEAAFLQLAEPGLGEVVERCIRGGTRRIAVVPFFLLPGAHVLEDIPKEVAALRRRHPGVEITLAPILGEHPKLAEAVADLAREVLG